MRRAALALAVTLGAASADAAPEYPPGLFEHSPLIDPNQAGPPSPQEAPGQAPAPSGPIVPVYPPYGSDDPPDGPPGAPDGSWRYGPPPPVPDPACFGIRHRLFNSMEEVYLARQRCGP